MRVSEDKDEKQISILLYVLKCEVASGWEEFKGGHAEVGGMGRFQVQLENDGGKL
jgi:hypothetical protein